MIEVLLPDGTRKEIAAKDLSKHYQEVKKRLMGNPNPPVCKEPEVQKIEPPPPKKSFEYHPLYVPLKRTDLTFSSTLEMTAEEFNITPKEIRLRCRQQKYSFPRSVAIYLTYKHKINSLIGMGRYLGLDHTSVIHANRKIERLVTTDDSLRERITALEERLLAAYPRPSVSAVSQSHMGSQETEGNEKVRPVPTVDSGG